MKMGKQARRDKNMKVDEFFEYILDAESFVKRKCTASKPEHFLDLQTIEEALRVNVSASLNRVLRLRQESKATKKDFINSVAATEIVELALLHIKFVTFLIF